MSAVAPATRGHADSHGHEGHPEVGFLKKYVFSIVHKVIGIHFLFMGLMFMVVGGLLAMLIRWQMAWPDDQTQGRDHPVPILAKTMWAKMTSDVELDIESVDSKTNTVVVKQPGWLNLKKEDEVKIKADATNEVPGKVKAVDGSQVTIEMA